MSPRETRILAAAALTALHVLDDATLNREPGTTVTDSLIGAGALLAVLAVSAAVLPRLRAGAHSILARSSERSYERSARYTFPGTVNGSSVVQHAAS